MNARNDLSSYLLDNAFNIIYIINGNKVFVLFLMQISEKLLSKNECW